jgi:hypothetical protein
MRPRQSALPRRLLAVVAAALVVVGGAWILESPPAARAASNGSWSVYPTTVPGTKPRVIFSPQLTPGKTTGDSVTVTNLSGLPETFDLYAADAFNTPGGGLSLRRRVDPVEGIGAWIHLGHSSIVVPPHTSIDVGFLVAVPTDATPGDHVGGIVAEQTTGTTSRRGSVPITVIQAVGVRVYGRVAGPAMPRLGVDAPNLAMHGTAGTLFGGTTAGVVSVRVANQGNVVLTPVAHVTITSPFGTVATKTIQVGPLLPRDSVTLHAGVSGLRASGSVDTKVNVQAQGAKTVSASSSQFTLPWGLIVVLLVLVGVVLTLLRWRRRRRRGRADAAEVQAVRGRHVRVEKDHQDDADPAHVASENDDLPEDAPT